MSLFTNLYKMDFNGQTAFLIKCMDARKPKRTKHPGISRKQTTFDYYIYTVKKKVCKKTFADIFGLSHKRIQVLQHKIKQGNFPPVDGRGRHSNKPSRIDDETKEKIRNHIKSFPSQESHYSRNTSKKMCLSPDLSLSRMYRMFKREFPDLHVKKYLYRQIFKECNLRFGFPRSDTCKECDKLYNKIIAADTEEESRKLKIESELHHRRAELAYKTMSEDSEQAKCDENYVVLAVDLQQVLFCPTLHHSNIFYQRQLSNYNFAVHNMGKNYVTMFLWNESVAKRGSAEIASCIFKYVLINFAPIQNQDRKLIIWSDRCVGQNNNWRMLSILHYVMQLGYFTSVEQKFLCSGHSFLPCDRDFALIEKRKKVCKVFVPSQWKYVIADARLEKPFEVVEMQRNDFKDFSCLDKNIKRDPKQKVTEVKWLKFSSDEPTMIKVRKSHNLIQPWVTHSFCKAFARLRNLDSGIRPENIPQLYEDAIKIKKEKYNDLMDMVLYLREEFKEFYINLAHL